MAQSLRREELQTTLEGLLGSRNVYFQPPENIRMNYPCVVYERDSVETKYADNEMYFRKKRYRITIIDRDPDSEIPDRIATLPLCRYSRFFTADNLNHDIFNLYF